jgi:hypothetical protein
MSYGPISAAIAWGVDHGWLTLVPDKDGRLPVDGQRKSYDLSIGHPGDARKAPPPRQDDADRDGQAADHYDSRSAPENSDRYDSRSGSGDERYETCNASEDHDRYGVRNATASGAVAEPLRHPKREHLTSVTSIDSQLASSIRPGSIRELLAQIGETDDDLAAEVEAVLIQDWSATKPAGLLHHLIINGDAPALIGKARQRIATHSAPASVGEAAQPGAADRLLSARQARNLCSRCDRTKHDPVPCADRESLPAPMLTGAETPCAAAEKCQRRHRPVPAGKTHHPVCAVIITTLHPSSAPDRASAPSQDGGEAA